MTEYIYESDDEARCIAREIKAIKDERKALDERLELLTARLADKHTDAVDWVDEPTGRRWYVRMERSRRRTVDMERLTVNYPEYVARVTRLVDDRKKLNRLIEGGLIDEDKVMTVEYGAKYAKVYEATGEER